MSIRQNSPTDLRLPEFLGVGPSRTGTTWLHDVLMPVAGLPRVKETFFFSRHYDRGIEWYAAQFRHCSAGALLGEVCPYFAAEDAPARVQHHMPKCKIVCTLRDPVDRAYSSYQLARAYGWTRVGFEETLRQRPRIMEIGRYAHYLRQWRERFGEPQVLVMIYDDLVSSRQTFVDTICDFVGAERVSLSSRAFSARAENRFERAPAHPGLARMASKVASTLKGTPLGGTVKSLSRSALWRLFFSRGEAFPPLEPEIDARLRLRLRPEIDALEELIQRDLSAWKSRPPSMPKTIPAR